MSNEGSLQKRMLRAVIANSIPMCREESTHTDLSNGCNKGYTLTDIKKLMEPND